ncbi:hypothetical protein [Herbaspirillum sp. meg3]|nr:hypothetical protein [Herbaspirillum sp. meg3]
MKTTAAEAETETKAVDAPENIKNSSIRPSGNARRPNPAYPNRWSRYV